MTTLDECRISHEVGSWDVLYQSMPDPVTLLVVLRDDSGKYHCHRYCAIGDKWDVSIDRQRCIADEAIRWLADPTGMSLRDLAHSSDRGGEYSTMEPTP